MPQDVITLRAIVSELATRLVGGRIDRITQPERDEVHFYIRAKGSNQCLVVSANPNGPRIHLTNVKKDNPYAAPAFLMHLRRHVMGGMIQSLTSENCDRIVRMDVLGRNEMHDEVTMHLYFELMGRYSNIIAVDADGHISDSLRHIPPAENQLRAILPHLIYELPPRAKIHPADREAVRTYLTQYTGGDIVKYLFGGVAGMVNITARELVYRAGLTGQSTPLLEAEASRLADEVATAYDACDSAVYAPCYSVDQAGDTVDYYIYPYATTGYDMIATDSLNAAVSVVSEAKDRAIRLKANGKHLASIIDNAVKKNEKLLGIARQKLLDCRDHEALRERGELLTAYLYRLHKGDSAATVYDYYHDCDVTIPLDVNLTPAENAQAYFKQYTKQKRTVAVATEQEKEYTEILDYLLSVKTAFDMAADAKELAEIERELIQNGYIRSPKGSTKQRTPPPLSPCRYTIEGFTIWRGKNNLQNEALTFHTARETDIWLHVKAAHGSHVIIVTDGKSVPDTALCAAAEIAAYYSDLQVGGKVAVDYAPRKHVKHHPAKKSGMVIYTDYQTLMVEPKAHKDHETN